MREGGVGAALALRVLLGGAVLCLVGGTVPGTGAWGAGLRTAGVGVVVAGPFVVLIVVAVRARRAAWYAIGTLALSLAGFLLAL